MTGGNYRINVYEPAGTRNGSAKDAFARLAAADHSARQQDKKQQSESGGEQSDASWGLAAIAGVRQTDSDAEMEALEHSVLARKAPRIAFSPQAAFAAILVLVCALSASLTLLLIQSRNMSSALAAASQAAASHSAQSKASIPSDSRRAMSQRQESNGTADAGAGNAAATGGVAASDSNSKSPSSAAIVGGKVNINAASAEQLQTVKGIGPSTAQKIVDYRNQHGNFAAVDALTNVSGIGEKKLAQMRPYLTVE